MKILILAGGHGTRLSEETIMKPKPMIEIGGKPILWHIMKIYSHYGFNEFVILTGYKGYMIKEYFSNYFLHQSDITFDLGDNSMTVHKNKSESWKVTIVDTGISSMTGGRVRLAKDYINNQRFMLTYGDGVANIDIKELLKSHIESKKKMTLTAIQPEGRFGALNLSENSIKSFKEKPKGDGNWVNGGFFVCEPEILEYIESDETILEEEPLKKLAIEDELNAYRHPDYWQCMDTKRDMDTINFLWKNNEAKWKMW